MSSSDVAARSAYRAAIIGCGRKGATLDDEVRCRVNYSIPPDAHATAWQQIRGIRLVAAADPNEPKRRLMQDRWDVPRVFADYRDLLEHEQIDLLSVTTRAPLHAEVTIAAAQAGVKGILCEKPLAVSLRQADEMIDACRRSRTILAVNHTRRWHSVYEESVRLMRDSSFGALRSIFCHCPAPLVHNGTHVFDIMRLFGGEVREVSGTLRADGDTTEDVGGRATLIFESGAVGFADVDSELGMAVEIHGNRRRLFIDPAEPGLEIWSYERPTRSEDLQWYQGGPCPERQVTHGEVPQGQGTLVKAIEELIDAVEGRGESRSAGEDGRAALELAMAVYESAAEGGRPMRLPLDRRDRTVLAR